MHKVWFGRFWVMTGRWALWSLSEPVRRPSVVSRAWIHQVYAPYWRGSGVALTAGPWSVRFGLCRPGIEPIEESAGDDFYWDEFGPSFDEHLEASLFEGRSGLEAETWTGVMEVEAVTAFVDTRTETTVAIVHEGGEVEYIKPVAPWVAS